MNLKYLIYISIILFTSLAYANNTGRICGTIIDKETDEPLPGVNVIIEKTILGASTDIEGQYTILNVPPGKYTILINYVGFETVRVEGVIVSSDSMTIIKAELEEQVIDMGDWDGRGCGRPIISIGISNKEYILDEDELFSFPTNLPISQVVNSFPGISFDIFYLGSNMRGGNSYNNLILIDGIPIDEHFGQYPYRWSNLCSIEEMRIVSGGFESEFGNSNAGMVYIYPKTGSYKFEGDFLINYTPQRLESSFNGKKANIHIGANISGKITKGFRYSFSHFNQSAPIPVENTEKNHKEHQSYLNINIYPNKSSHIEILGEYNKTNSHGISDTTLIHSVLFTNPNKLWQASEYQNKNTVEIYPFTQYMYRLGFKTDYTFNHSSFATYSLQKQYTNFDLNKLDTMSNSFDFNFPKGSNAESWTSKFMYVNQIDKNNMIKTGIEYLNSYYILQNNPGNNNIDNFDAKSSLYSLFLQDRFETTKYIANIGLRYDYLTPKIDSENFQSKANWKFSPRIGIIYKLDYEGKIFGNYGVYYQTPDYLKLAHYNSFSIQDSSSINLNNQEVEFDKSIHYEIGFEQLFDHQWLAFSSLYYKEINTNQNRFINNYPFNSTIRYVKGIELGFERIFDTYIYGSVYYDYSILDDKFDINSSFKNNSWNNSNLTIHLILQSPEKWGFKIYNYFPFSNFKINFYNQWFETSKPDIYLYEVDYNIFNINIQKEIRYTKYKLNLFLKVQNLFNKQIEAITSNIKFKLFPRNFNFGFRFQF